MFDTQYFCLYDAISRNRVPSMSDRRLYSIWISKETKSRGYDTDENCYDPVIQFTGVVLTDIITPNSEKG